MQYHTIQFIEFLTAVTLLYYTLLRRFQKQLLLFAGLAFFALLGWDSLLTVLAATLLTFFMARAIAAARTPKQKKGLLWLAVLLQLSVLALFKGYGLLVRVSDRVFAQLGVDFMLPAGPFLSAVGISFYMMQTIAYTVDVYRGDTQPENSLFRYALFTTFFPQVLQGPIPRKEQLVPQLTQPHAFEYDHLKYGVQLLFWGLFKKLVIADRLSPIVARIYDSPNHYTGALAALGVVFYSIQLYCDFSGCVDIARGASQMLGIRLPENFRQPYLARSIPDFWRRWHITLSSWLKDYVYIPLGGSRRGAARKYLNIIAVFFVSALWHGAGWTFLVWGGLHALYQVAGIATRPLRNKLRTRLHIPPDGWLTRTVQTLFTFALTSFGWLFFRAASLSQAREVLSRILTDFRPRSLVSWQLTELVDGGKNLLVLAVAVLAVVAVEIRQNRGGRIRPALGNAPYAVQCAVNLALLMAVVIFGAYGAEMAAVPFLYFNF